MTNTKQKRDIEISKNIAMFHIHSQAGSIEKALSEAVMNSVDAKATEIRIDIADDGRHYCIADNGCGFASEEEITECFGTLGFDHTTQAQKEKGRTFGSFGLGRAQLWSWSKNTWKSGPYRMHVDLEANGLTYELETDAAPVAGCTLEGEFYTPITTTELADLRRNLKDLTQYMEIDIVFNGSMISTPIKKMKWDRITDEAYCRFTEYGGLKVFNQGMLVTTYPTSKFGVSGLIISRKNLTLNVARNEVMQNACETWPAILTVIKEEAKKVGKKNAAKLTDADRLLMLRTILTDRDQATDLLGKYVLRAVNGRYYSVKQLVNKFEGRWTIGDFNFSPTGESVINRELALVLAPNTFDQLGFSAEDFQEAMQRTISYNSYEFQWDARKELTHMDYKALAAEAASSVEVLDEKKLTKKQLVALIALRRINTVAARMTRRDTGERKVYLGNKRDATAWTDGKLSIGYDAKSLVRSLDQGYEGFLKALLVLTHEYAHTDPTTSDHAHDVEFYKRYHDASMHAGLWTTDIHRAVAAYGKEMVKKGLSIPKSVARSITRSEGETMVKELDKRAVLEH